MKTATFQNCQTEVKRLKGVHVRVAKVSLLMPRVLKCIYRLK